jgi:hypothetical protein
MCLYEYAASFLFGRVPQSAQPASHVIITAKFGVTLAQTHIREKLKACTQKNYLHLEKVNYFLAS